MLMPNKEIAKRRDELAQLAAPLVEWLRKHFDPHTEIIIDSGFARVTQLEFGVTFAYADKPKDKVITISVPEIDINQWLDMEGFQI